MLIIQIKLHVVLFRCVQQACERPKKIFSPVFTSYSVAQREGTTELITRECDAPTCITPASLLSYQLM